MGGELFFSSGAAARQLNTSPDTIRRLVAAGSIPSETSPGGHVRISSQAVEELRRTGLPSLPKPLPGDNPLSGPAKARYGSATLLAPPSEQVIEGAEEVVLLENEVKSLGLRQRKEEALDWFRSRERDQAEELAADEREERARLARDQANQERVAWFRRWQKYALDAMPYGADPQDELDLDQAVRGRLATLTPIPDDSATRTLVDAEVRKILQARRRQKEIEEAVQNAADGLPSAARSYWKPTQWQLRAMEAARQAARQLPIEATMVEIEAVARRAVEPITTEFQCAQAAKADAETRDSITRWARFPDGLSEPAKELATTAIREALAAMPLGTPRDKLERAVEAALAPYHQAVAELQAQAHELARRQAAEARKEAEEARRKLDHEQAEARRLSDAEFRVSLRMGHIFNYLDRLGRDEIEFNNFFDQWNTSEKLKEKIRPALVAQLLQKPDMSDEEANKRIEKLVDQHLDSVLEPRVVAGRARKRYQRVNHQHARQALDGGRGIGA